MTWTGVKFTGKQLLSEYYANIAQKFWNDDGIDNRHQINSAVSASMNRSYLTDVDIKSLHKKPLSIKVTDNYRDITAQLAKPFEWNQSYCSTSCHIVLPGETMSSIAVKYGISEDRLKQIVNDNSVNNTDVLLRLEKNGWLSVGDKIYLSADLIKDVNIPTNPAIPPVSTEEDSSNIAPVNPATPVIPPVPVEEECEEECEEIPTNPAIPPVSTEEDSSNIAPVNPATPVIPPVPVEEECEEECEEIPTNPAIPPVSTEEDSSNIAPVNPETPATPPSSIKEDSSNIAPVSPATPATPPSSIKEDSSNIAPVSPATPVIPPVPVEEECEEECEEIPTNPAIPPVSVEEECEEECEEIPTNPAIPPVSVEEECEEDLIHDIPAQTIPLQPGGENMSMLLTKLEIKFLQEHKLKIKKDNVSSLDMIAGNHWTNFNDIKQLNRHGVVVKISSGSYSDVQQQINILSKLPSLTIKSLHINDSLGLDQMANIFGLRHIEELNYNNNSDVGKFQVIDVTSNIKKLHLSNTNLLSSFKFRGWLPNLEYIDLSNNPKLEGLTKEDIAEKIPTSNDITVKMPNGETVVILGSDIDLFEQRYIGDIQMKYLQEHELKIKEGDLVNNTNYTVINSPKQLHKTGSCVKISTGTSDEIQQQLDILSIARHSVKKLKIHVSKFIEISIPIIGQKIPTGTIQESISQIPDMRALTYLEELDLSGNNKIGNLLTVESLPSTVNKLYIADTGLPKDFDLWFLNDLEYVDLSGNQHLKNMTTEEIQSRLPNKELTVKMPNGNEVILLPSS